MKRQRRGSGVLSKNSVHGANIRKEHYPGSQKGPLSLGGWKGRSESILAMVT